MNKELEYFDGDELAASTWRNKYAMEGEETPDDMHKRLAKEFYLIERSYPSDVNSREHRLALSDYGRCRKTLTETDIYELFKDFRYIIPGGSVMSGLGTGNLVSLSNCFVIGSPEDSYAEIMKTRNYQVQLMKRRGGVGYDLSQLRPCGSTVNNAARTSTGAASFMEVCSHITNEVAQNGRRGALMLSISINHPDIEEFITKKQDLTKVTGANISVKVTDDFMNAVSNDLDYYLRYPVEEVNVQVDSSKPYNTLYSYTEGDKTIYIKKIKARELWDKLIHCAWNTAEPGIMFEDTMHNFSPDGVYSRFKMVGTNPCGEIPMGPFDSCRLIHLNLTSFVDDPFTEKAKVDLDKLYKISYEAMRLADDLVDLEILAVCRIIDKVKNDPDSTEYNLWNRIKDTAILGRRAGVGITGVADTLAMLGIGYSSLDGIKMMNTIMEKIFLGQLDSTIDMSIQRGAFISNNPSIEYIGPTLQPGNMWYGGLLNKYPDRARRMITYGRRNVSWSTVAPVGTVSIMARCSSGIEPVFLPYYERKRKCMSSNDRVDYVDSLGEKYTVFIVVHPNLRKWVLTNKLKGIESNFAEHCLPKYTTTNDLEWYVDNIWTTKEWETAFKHSPYYGSTAPEINCGCRVKMQSVIQEYITHSISSTINLPASTTENEISDIYMESWMLGNKGQTVYRDGCREGILNKLGDTKKIEGRDAPKRPITLEADYHQVKVKKEQFIVLIGLLEGKPYEVFAFRPLRPVNIIPHRGKITKVERGHYKYESEYITISDLQLANTNIEEKATTLYSSMLLRHGVDIKYIVKIVKKVNENIVSFSSAVCRILSKYITDKEVKGEVCPECGGRLVREGGCIRCLDCSYSKCM